ncbi:hypothetical protein SOASR030_28410 [Leminorella grimontii]|uniref:GNAT family N-acetyltransferase n=1 Tax=Leminorella grimontii TaxID=82981 RepID=A0AAV5N6Z7_9GAMM|nr:hypothetical protein [Leminorella grimontii]KFC92846.1 hypothetical protein GLGR_3542 [Leminorella grimontii ATCC 33999 = DSM 5078]GKX56729.1 hypothetical protein SOASR030_28410 [Leminorella grimontii]VFS62179.1 Uncharacterised protein [Leminorella grimontii]
MTDYRAHFQRVSTLSAARREQMADIYFQSYAGSDASRFMSDLADKDEALLLEYRGRLVGFSSVQFYEHERALIVYSGDTIVMPEHWMQQTLHRVWISRMALLYKQHPQKRLYWFLLVKGLRTYKYLKAFAKTFYPHWQRDEPELQRLADALASKKFGALYNPQSGVVECPPHYGYLKEALADIAPTLHGRPEVDFFLQKNPHYSLGHELVCLCEIAPDNLAARYQKLFINPDVEFYDE